MGTDKPGSLKVPRWDSRSDSNFVEGFMMSTVLPSRDHKQHAFHTYGSCHDPCPVHFHCFAITFFVRFSIFASMHMLRYICFNTAASIHLPRYTCFDTAASIPLLRYLCFDSLASAPLLRLTCAHTLASVLFFDSLRSIPSLRYLCFDGPGAIALLRNPSFDTIASIPLLRILLCR